MTPESVDFMSTPCYFHICNLSLLCCDTATVPSVPLTVPQFFNMYISSCTFCLGLTVLFSTITPSLVSNISPNILSDKPIQKSLHSVSVRSLPSSDNTSRPLINKANHPQITI